MSSPIRSLGRQNVRTVNSHYVYSLSLFTVCQTALSYVSLLTQVGDSLEDLAIRKQQIINHLQVEPVFMESGTSLQLADGHKGFAGLKTVLTNNKQMQEAMPKSVSDMFVATRSTQSLDELRKFSFMCLYM